MKILEQEREFFEGEIERLQAQQEEAELAKDLEGESEEGVVAMTPEKLDTINHLKKQLKRNSLDMDTHERMKGSKKMTKIEQ